MTSIAWKNLKSILRSSPVQFKEAECSYCSNNVYHDECHLESGFRLSWLEDTRENSEYGVDDFFIDIYCTNKKDIFSFLKEQYEKTPNNTFSFDKLKNALSQDNKINFKFTLTKFTVSSHSKLNREKISKLELELEYLKREIEKIHSTIYYNPSTDIDKIKQILIGIENKMGFSFHDL